MPPKIDLTGQKFNRLQVIKEIPFEFRNDPKCVEWECLCDCGKKINLPSSRLSNNHTKSCGCLKKDQPGNLIVGKYMMDNRKNDPLTTSKRDAFSTYKDGDLTFDKAMELFDYPCEYCGLKHSNLKRRIDDTRSEFYKENCEFRYNGLDRIDSSLPHLLINCLTACKFCNKAKNNENILDFLNRLKRIYITIHNTNLIDLKNKIKIPKDINEFLIKNNFIFNNKNTHKFTTINNMYKKIYLDGNITSEEFLYLSSLKCSYCKIAPYNNTKHQYTGEIYYYNGLDRIDSVLTHTLDNVLPCCKHCNSAKGTMTYEQFQEWIGRTYNYLFVMNNVENILNKYNNLQSWIKNNCLSVKQ